MQILNTLAPLFLLLALGVVLRRKGFAPPAFFRSTARLVYWVAIPAQLFVETAGARIEGGAALRVFGVLLFATAGCILLGYVGAALLHLPRPAVGAFVQGSFRGNLAYVGLPVILLATTGAAADGGVRTLAVLAIAFLIPVYNLVAVVVLIASGVRSAPRRMWAAIATNPLLLSCAAGLIYSATGLALPQAVRQTLSTAGQMATPLALIGIGASLNLSSVQRKLGPSLGAGLIKCGVAPLIGYVAARHLGLSPLATRIALIYLACPTAATSFIMAQELGADEELAASIIAVSTTLAIPALIAVLLIT